MTVKQLIRNLKNPRCERIAAIRIEFADGGIYEIAPNTRYGQRQVRRSTASQRARIR
jgi:hypothetical protein